MLSIENLSYLYSSGDGINGIAFSASGVIGVVGENGAGKTTLFNCIAGLLSGAGIVRLHDEVFDPETSPVSYMPAFDYYYSDLSGRQNWEILGRMCGLEKKHYTQHEELIHDFGLDPHLDKPFSACSTGIRKKLQFVGSLFSPARLCIYDEPHNGVDLVSNLKLNRELRKLADNGKIVLFSSHIMENVQTVSDSVIWIQQGRVQEHCHPPYTDLSRRLIDQG
ncbi:ATP-binding cassette domain-containing protein [Spirochaeta dissipatitropha]